MKEGRIEMNELPFELCRRMLCSDERSKVGGNTEGLYGPRKLAAGPSSGAFPESDRYTSRYDVETVLHDRSVSSLFRRNPV